MSPIRSLPIVAAFLFFLPGSAMAAAGGDADVMPLFWQGVNLLLLIGALVYVGRKPIQEFFQSRHEQVKGDLDSASSVLSEAEGRLAEWQARADRLDAEVEEIKATARDRAATESVNILADAEASAERIKANAHAAMDQEIARARAELRAEAAELATKLAAELLQNNVTDADEKRLVDEFVARIEATGNGPQH